MSSPAALAAAESVIPAGEPPHYSREALVRLTALAIDAGWDGGIEAAAIEADSMAGDYAIGVAIRALRVTP